MRRQTALVGGLVLALLPSLIVGGSASAATPHVVQPGETLWSIAAANNFTTRTVAAFNGLPEDAMVVEGSTVQVPTVEEGAAALASAGIAPAPSSASASTSSAASSPAPAPEAGSTYGLGHIPSAWGELHLDPAAADAWNAMRDASLSQFGIDLAPAGPLSAFRSYDQQAYLYDLFLSGRGAPANPARDLHPRARDRRRPRRPHDALGDRPDRRRLRLGRQHPLGVVARRLPRMTRPAGFEPAASRSGGERSIH